MNSKDITYYRNIHEIKLKKYIEDKLRNVENELGISLKNIEFVGWASSNSKKPDEIRIASNIHIKLDDGIYKNENKESKRAIVI